MPFIMGAYSGCTDQDRCLKPNRDFFPEVIKTLTIELSDETAAHLEALADPLGMSLEEVARAALDDHLKRLSQEYNEAAKEVLSKNAELYRRLS